MQVPYFEYWANRVLFYVSKIYIGQIQKGDDYDKLQKCIHVSILDFIHFPQDNRCYRKITLCDVETGEQYTDLMELHVLELKKLRLKIRMKTELSAGCVSLEGRIGRSSKIWRRKTNISKRHMKI